MKNSKENIPFVFFGTSKFAVLVLDELKKAGFLPSLLITQEDKPQGRHLHLAPPPTKIWAKENNTPVLQPSKLDRELAGKLKIENCKLFIVASYGKIIPKAILDIPEHGTLNVHPSLLPKLRGPSPIESAILNEDETGVSIMLVDEEMDHGPILVSKKIPTPEWPMYYDQLEELLAKSGGQMLSEVIPDWISGKIEAKDQNHGEATFCKKIKKEDGEINLDSSPLENLRKIKAYSEWPRTWTYIETKKGKIRVIITKASISEEKLVLEKVIPEGKKEMSWEDFQRGFLNRN